ncbi:alpha-hydroxy acid oxidase [Jannaschia seohaensis]|uniref:L-lactate dehydrogenase (Cytochrome) n=1 Tax=Jannaschia seohaensis TaxID=475081 RepID=A0A2Y9C0R7_9RHOB|nr:alpha-hydroxy acid oxidase [Jannaschia seohaensis]PWJ18217.1 L-lactate dehydrogenase (cytochrome) [Jannaschia seohaensis]SSA46742.1 L-lactate dehydrogenase (cytochrome) [Jannaschia seohaensis]
MDLDVTHPALSDLRRKAKSRMPHFAFEYLDSGTGTEKGVTRNRERMDAVQFMPAILRGDFTPDLRRTTLGVEHSVPFGVAPVGMAGLLWPDAERILARAAADHRIPYGQSTVAAATPEDTGGLAGEMGWFQHYPVRDPEIRRDMLRRIKEAGWRVLVVTVDVPGESRRERQRRAHVSMPPVMTPKIIASIAARPAWALGIAKHGQPTMKFPNSYGPQAKGKDAFVHAGRLIRGFPDDAYIKAIREEWDGPLIVKGVAEPQDATRLIEMGVDAIWVSNHSGRQFEGGPAAIDCLPPVIEAVGGRVPVYYCSGVQGGLDILRALALGADFVFLGKAWYFALAAFGRKGVDHLVHILKSDMISNMTQIGAASIDDLPGRLISSKRP